MNSSEWVSENCKFARPAQAWVKSNCKFARPAQAWVKSNCKFAAFNPPKQGDRITIPGRPDPYYLIDLPANRYSDGSWGGLKVRGENGLTQYISCSDVPSWSHYRGQKYPWDEEEQQKSLVATFQGKYKFKDGQPLRTNPTRPMIISINRGAPGSLAAFEDERLQIQRIDYANETVQLFPIGEGLADLAGYLTAVPVADVIAAGTPIMNPVISSEPVTLSSGERITAEDLLHLTPGLNRLARNGQVSLPRAQAYVNYYSKRGGTGPQIFAAAMEARGISIEDIPGYSENRTERKYDETGKALTVLGPWSGDVLIAPPVPEEVKAEIARVAPESKIQMQRNGMILVQSNALYKQMVSLGVLDAAPPSSGNVRRTAVPV